MELLYESDYAAKIESLIKQFAPYQKVIFCYDFSLQFEHLNEIEKILKGSCVCTKFIYAAPFSYEKMNTAVAEGCRLAIFACSSENMFFIKQNAKLDDVKTVYLPTDINLCGYLLNRHFCICEKQDICIISSSVIFEEFQDDLLSPVAYLSALVMHCFYALWYAMTLQNTTELSDAQNKFNSLCNEIDEILNCTNYTKKRQLLLSLYASYLTTANCKLPFHDAACIISQNLDYFEVNNISTINCIAIMCMINAIKCQNILIADIFKHAKTNFNRYCEVASTYYLFATSKAAYTIQTCNNNFLFSLNKISTILESIRNYLNLKNFQTQQIPVIKKCNFLLKNVKKYLKNCESMDILTYTYFYNIFEKVNDNI